MEKSTINQHLKPHMSKINTNKINENYPVMGINNNTQGFRDNFSSIKSNLDIAFTEITDLEDKVILKAPLTGKALNNDMNNNVISNMLTRGSRQTTTALGYDLSGKVYIDVNAAEVYYGTLAANSTITPVFSGWTPTKTKSSVELRLSTLDSNSYVNFTGSAVDSTKEFLENYSNNQVNSPHGTNYISLLFSSMDVGSTIQVTPLVHSSKLKQLTSRTPTSTGQPGDVAGSTYFDSGNLYVCVKNYDGISVIWKKVQLGVL
jgi:hypothetical protein